MTAAEARREHDFRAAAVERRSPNATVTIPPAMIEREAHHLYHELEESVGERGLTMEVYLGVLEKTPEEVEKELRRAPSSSSSGASCSTRSSRPRVSRSATTSSASASRTTPRCWGATATSSSSTSTSRAGKTLRDEMLMAKAVDFIAENAVAVERAGRR